MSKMIEFVSCPIAIEDYWHLKDNPLRTVYPLLYPQECFCVKVSESWFESGVKMGREYNKFYKNSTILGTDLQKKKKKSL